MKLGVGSLIAVFALYADVTALGKKIVADLADPAVKAEVEANPVLKPMVAQLSADWRTLENDEIAVHKSNILTFWGRAGTLLVAGGALEREVNSDLHNPEAAAALDSMPATKAALAALAGDWAKVDADLRAAV